MASTRCRRRTALLAVLVVAAAVVLACVLRGGDEGEGTASGAASTPRPPVSTGTADDSPPQTDGGEPGASLPSESVGSISAGELAARVGDASSRREWTLDEEVSQVANEVLEGYAERGDTVLAHAGWLDLLGSVWGCTVSGPGWVDLCFVEREGEDASRVTVLRMEVDQWEESYGEAQTEQGSRAVP